MYYPVLKHGMKNRIFPMIQDSFRSGKLKKKMCFPGKCPAGAVSGGSIVRGKFGEYTLNLTRETESKGQTRELQLQAIPK